VAVVAVVISEMVYHLLQMLVQVVVVVEMVHQADHLLDLEEIQEELVVQDLHTAVPVEVVVLVVLE
jgi:hypothetical protein